MNGEEIFNKLTKGGNLAVIVGRRGSGKTALGFTIAEKAREKGKEVFLVGFPPEVKKLVPGFMEIVGSLNEVPNGAFALLDEAILLYNARKWQSKSNLTLAQIADLARHKDISVVFIAINTAMLDANVLRTLDTLIMKESSLLQSFMERPFLKKFFEKVNRAYNDIPADQRNAYAYVFDDSYEGMIPTALPSFWSQELSKSWKDYAGETLDSKQKGIKVVGLGSLAIGQQPICYDCQHFVTTKFEAWCAAGFDVGVMECGTFSKKQSPKVWSWKKQRRPYPMPARNPPVGVGQCYSCGNYCGISNVGVSCLHPAIRPNPVKFINGMCPYVNPHLPPEEAKQKLQAARVKYAEITATRGSGSATVSCWDEWLGKLRSTAFTFVEATNGQSTHKYRTFSRSDPSKSYITQVHKREVTGVTETRQPFSCSCHAWIFSTPVKQCKHALELADIILNFECSGIPPGPGPGPGPRPIRVEEVDEPIMGWGPFDTVEKAREFIKGGGGGDA